MHILAKFDYVEVVIAFLKLYGDFSIILLICFMNLALHGCTIVIHISEGDFSVTSRNQEHPIPHCWDRLLYPPSVSAQMLSFSSSKEVYVYFLSMTYRMRLDSRNSTGKRKEKECHYTISQNNYRKPVFLPFVKHFISWGFQGGRIHRPDV